MEREQRVRPSSSSWRFPESTRRGVRARFRDSKVVDKAGSLDTKTARGKRLPDGADVNALVPVVVSLNPSITCGSH